MIRAGCTKISAPAFITSTLYEADGQTKEINYANGVKTAFVYSRTRRSAWCPGSSCQNTWRKSLVDQLPTVGAGVEIVLHPCRLGAMSLAGNRRSKIGKVRACRFERSAWVKVPGLSREHFLLS
ncbi:hypothetical protein [Mesorhizobium sp. WSM4311]|uniref:hypothetical protein n=1 Tax=Mesorhizobium sp. WSM4311 TaxID=2029410 RepID=UPI0015CCD49A|nr:hypothetical protein [Mesorhizobium sp. WSM4311]